MTKTDDETVRQPDALFVYGLDENGKPRGARFAELNNKIVSVAMDMKCHIVTNPSADVAALVGTLPVGRIYASGNAIIPNIKRDLYDLIVAAVRVSDEDEAKAFDVALQSNIKLAVNEAEVIVTEVRCKSPMLAGLPRSWEDIDVGHMVLTHESLDDGWWEAVVIKRDDEILTLRFRDYPKQPVFIRHINTVALVNPGLC